MWGGLIILGLVGSLSIISMGESMFVRNKENRFLSLLATHNMNLMDFCVSLLSTKQKDWSMQEFFELKTCLHPALSVLYCSGMEQKEDRRLRIVFENQFMLDVRVRKEGEPLETRSYYKGLLEFSMHDQVKLEHVLNHIHSLYTQHLQHQKEEVALKKQQEIEKKERETLRLKETLTAFLSQEVTWNVKKPHFWWHREVDLLHITLTLYVGEEVHYICSYEKKNKTMHSKMVKTKNEESFTQMKPLLDTWCQQQLSV